MKMKYPRDLTGQKFGKLTVTGKSPEKYVAPNGRTDSIFYCHCDCVKESDVRRSQLLTGRTKSCGCNGFSQRNDLTGIRFGFLTVLKRSDIPITYRDGKKRSRWICKCDCGNVHEATRTDLVKGKVRSCGCSRSRQRTILGE